MIIAMSRSWRHPETGVFYFRSRLPADRSRVVAGRTLAVAVAADGSTVKLAYSLKICLRTKDEGEARLRHASVPAQVQQRWAAASTGATSRSKHEMLAAPPCVGACALRRFGLATLCLNNGVQVRLISGATTATLEDGTLLNGKSHVMNVAFHLGG